MKKNDPISFAKAVEFDYKLRDPKYPHKYDNERYLHQLAIPLEDAVTKGNEQLDFTFINECEGMCGV